MKLFNSTFIGISITPVNKNKGGYLLNKKSSKRMSAASKTFAISLVVLGLNACSIWPEYMRPTINLPEVFSSQSQVTSLPLSAPNRWWELYADDMLNHLIEEALKNNTDVIRAAARVEEADAALREAGAVLFPQIDLAGAGSKRRLTEAGLFPVFFANPLNTFNTQFSTNYEIDFWGKLRGAKASAKAQALSTHYAQDTVSLSLTSQVAMHYFALRGADSQIAVTQNNLKSRDESLALTKRRLEGGVVSLLDVHQAEVASANLAAQLTELRRMREITQHQLALLTANLALNVPAADILILPMPPIPPTGLPSSLLEARPDIRQAEAVMIAADANIGVAKAALYPSISLTGTYGGESLALSDLLSSPARIWSAGFAFNLPIFNSGRLKSRVDQASARQKLALANYQAAIQSAFTEMNNALVNYRQYAELEEALVTSEAAAKKALEVSQNRYQSGYSAYLEVLDAQRVYNDTAMQFVQSRQARMIATVDIFRAMGGGWQDRNKSKTPN